MIAAAAVPTTTWYLVLAAVLFGVGTVGVLVQTNFGGVLTIAGAPVGRELGQYYLKDELEHSGGRNPADGSVIVVIATDAPADHRTVGQFADPQYAIDALPNQIHQPVALAQVELQIGVLRKEGREPGQDEVTRERAMNVHA